MATIFGIGDGYIFYNSASAGSGLQTVPTNEFWVAMGIGNLTNGGTSTFVSTQLAGPGTFNLYAPGPIDGFCILKFKQVTINTL